MYIHNLVDNIVIYNEFSHCLLYNSCHSSLLHGRVCNVRVCQFRNLCVLVVLSVYAHRNMLPRILSHCSINVNIVLINS